MIERRLNGHVMGRQQARVAGECPPHAHRLRRRERGIEPGHRPHRPAVRCHPVAEHGPERCPRDRVTPLQQQLEVVGLDPPGQAEVDGLAARPHSRLLPRSVGQVLRVVGGRRSRRRGVQRRHPQHALTPALRALVCSPGAMSPRQRQSAWISPVRRRGAAAPSRWTEDRSAP